FHAQFVSISERDRSYRSTIPRLLIDSQPLYRLCARWRWSPSVAVDTTKRFPNIHAQRKNHGCSRGRSVSGEPHPRGGLVWCDGPTSSAQVRVPADRLQSSRADGASLVARFRPGTGGCLAKGGSRAPGV